ncbi:pilus assembly protein TadG-related protein [Microbacterium sp.]|uniref:pilus assembly protein TadG-related protein n=1 Tax=Microbacterium sp. TaxID=51671 RepID=UPI0035AF6C6E
MTRPTPRVCRCTHRRNADDEGSVLILTLGYAVLALVAVFVCVDATSLYLAQKRIDAVADAAALAAADGFAFDVRGAEAVAVLTDAGVRDQAEAIVAEVGGETVLVSASTPDGVSARVTVAGTWHPPVFTLFVPDGVALAATATSRTALR